MHLQEKTRIRASDAVFAVDQANAIYSLVFVTLSEFSGFDNVKWLYRLEAQARVSGLVPPEHPPGEILGAAFLEVAQYRLPRLLCISLVSSVEACLEDIAAIEIAAHLHVTAEKAAREADQLMRGSPRDYLPKLEALGLAFVAGHNWQELREIVATRNVLVHGSQLVADNRYVEQAGTLARATVGGTLVVDNDYLISSYIGVRSMLSGFLIDEGRHGS